MAKFVVSNGVVSSGVALGTADKMTVLNEGQALNTLVQGKLVIQSGGLTTRAEVDHGEVMIQGGGTSFDSLLSNDGTMTVLSGGTAIGGSVAQFGIITIGSGGLANDITVTRNGELDVHGTAYNTYDGYAGTEVVEIGGQSFGSVLEAGARQEVKGHSTSALLQFHAAQLIYKGGVATDTTLNIGVQAIESSGLAVNTLLISGFEELYSGGAAQGTDVFAGGILALEGGVATGTVVETGGALDFTSISYSTSDTVTFNSKTGVLKVSGGGSSATIKLSGNYANEHFALTSGTIEGGTMATLISGAASGGHGADTSFAAAIGLHSAPSAADFLTVTHGGSSVTHASAATDLLRAPSAEGAVVGTGHQSTSIQGAVIVPHHV